MSSKFIPLTEPLYEYLVTKRSNVDDPVLEALRTETETLGDISMMSISPEQGSLMTLLVGIIGAKWAVEVGTFTGTSSICIARGMVPGGKLICFDQDFKWTTIARRYWAKAGVADRIELKLGAARELLTRFRPQNQLDFVFIDADKESYDFYYETILPYVRPGGLIVLDNMLRGGEVVHPVAKTRPINRAIDQLNRKIATDNRVQSVLLPMADGMVICRKLFVAGGDGRNMRDSRRVT
jgi:caffeoyl-CoA O-methyltransferase